MALRLDKQKIADGVIFKCHVYPNEDGSIPWVRCSMLSEGNSRYQLRMEALTRPHRRQLQLGTYGEEKAEALRRKAFIDTCLFDWGDVQDENGKPIPFSSENAEQFFGDPENYPIYKWMIEEAQIFEAFAKEAREIEAKN